MAGVAQRRIKLGGTWYDRGAAVPDEMVTARTVGLGLVAASSGDLEQTKAELAEALERAKAAEARVAALEAAPAAGGGQGSKPGKPAKATRTSSDDTGGSAEGE